ncbi:MAG: V-type ATP synthase subunit D [Thermoplasmata archaeon M9B1D]|nr:MAG: V-type ATP synthase subunit D [Thermoplasmata archaeon M8B2D]PNX49467.1 MAG: V-type ATP synthase subunit D [Thermoplasmata archaeon M9B1D]
MEGVSPTRMDLLEIRKKLVLAEKGHKILEEKRDSLVEKFFGVIHTRNELAKQLDDDFKGSFQSLIQAQMILGEKKVEEISYVTPEVGEVDFETDNIMGVKIPKINPENITTEIQPSYDFIETCSKLDDTQKDFKQLLKKLIELADLEGSIKSLAVEIEKTKRRVNVLENNLIPKLHATRKYIEMQLEEREREDFFRRKRIKAVMDAKKE